MPKIVFMGTPEFAVPSFKALLDAGFEIPLLVCQPDRKKGRGHKIQYPPTKDLALLHNIEVYQPEKIRNEEAIAKLASIDADFFVVIAYGKILPRAILDLPKKACINTHASLLPKWRGAAPIQFSILKGDQETGVCTMLMDEEMDTGDILQVRKTEIGRDEKVDSLNDRLSSLGADLIVETIRDYDSLEPINQNHEEATYTRLLKKEDRFIDWTQSSHQIYCHFRAMTPFPGVVSFFRGKRLLLKSIKPSEQFSESFTPGEIFEVGDDYLKVACGEGMIKIFSCQPENKKELAAKDFVNGFQVKPNEILEGSQPN